MATAELTSRALTCYRALLRARAAAFKNDASVLLASRNKIKTEFKKNAAETDATKIQQMIKYGEDVAVFIRQNVVQARKTEKGTYKVEVRPETEKTELKPKSKATPSSGGGCGSKCGCN
eukprot:comp47228_c0_seq1/m.47595 comp47228_c0_seq1/g.47595  ORF comp47228_c0_seq1/g.47595 comp47228_c0_seq1/m.47595 type:complete len:119 (-) comp47228_c0_seq1:30-386(-)